MNNNGYLIPANSKKSMLIFSFFNVTDLIIFITGIFITFILLFLVDASSMRNAVFILSPALFVSFMVVPIPNHHNIRTLIINIYTYFLNRRRYFWRGWCIKHVEK